MNKLKQEDYDINKIFKEALGFRKTYDILNNTINPSNVDNIDYLTPMITCIIFSCELYLKSLLVFLKKDFEREHSLNTLFKLLPEELQLDIENTFNKHCFKKTYFKECLKASDKSYTEFRYYFSYSDNISFHMTFFEKFNDILLKETKSVI